MMTSSVHFSVQGTVQLEFPDRSLDALMLCNSLHVMEKLEKALAEARRVLKRKGLLIVPNRCLGETKRARRRAEEMVQGRGFPGPPLHVRKPSRFGAGE